MKNAGQIILVIISIVLLFFKVSRCTNQVSKMQSQAAKKAYFDECQKVIDSIHLAFVPVEKALSYGKAMPDDQLTRITSRLYDMAVKARNLDVFNDEGGYYKKRAEDYAEFLRGLTCCYLPKYQQEIKKPASMQTGTVTNLRNWIDQYYSWQPKYRDEPFVYYNTADFSLLRASLDKFETDTRSQKSSSKTAVK